MVVVCALGRLRVGIEGEAVAFASLRGRVGRAAVERHKPRGPGAAVDRGGSVPERGLGSGGS